MAYYSPTQFFDANGEQTVPRLGDVVSYDRVLDRFTLQRGGSVLSCLIPNGNQQEYWRPSIAYTEAASIAARISMLPRPYLNLRLLPNPKKLPVESWVLVQ